MGFGERYDVPVGVRDGAAEKRDLYLARQQAELLVNQLREEGRELAASIVEELDQRAGQALRDLEEVRADLAELQAGAKSSRGKDRASAPGTISGKGRAAGAAPSFGSSKSSSPATACTKHKFGSDNVCIRIVGGVKCEATRQRQRKAKQTVIPGTDGASSTTGEAVA